MAKCQVVGVFLALAIISVIARAAAHLYFRRRLNLDDYLLFAVDVLLASSGRMHCRPDGLSDRLPDTFDSGKQETS